jgi:hypothetical protein
MFITGFDYALFYKVARRLYEKRVQDHIRLKSGNFKLKATVDDFDNPENVKAFADWHDPKKGSVNGCPAYDIALEAGFVEESNKANKPSQWHQIRAIVFRDSMVWEQLERLMEGYANAKIPHPRAKEARHFFIEQNKKKNKSNDMRSKAVIQTLSSLG